MIVTQPFKRGFVTENRVRCYCTYSCMYVWLSHIETHFQAGIRDRKQGAVLLYIYLYVCMVITYSKSMDQPGMVAIPACGLLNKKKTICPCPRSRLKIWSRETGSAVPSRVSLLISILRLNLVLTYGIPPEFRGGFHTFIQSAIRHRVSPEFIGSSSCVPMAFTAESAGAGPVNLKVVPNECCLGRSSWTNSYSPLFPTPTIGIKWAC